MLGSARSLGGNNRMHILLSPIEVVNKYLEDGNNIFKFILVSSIPIRGSS